MKEFKDILEEINHNLEWCDDAYQSRCYRRSHDEITRLRSDLSAVTEERDRMREALEPLAKAIKGQIADILFGEMPDNSTATVILQLGDLRRARAALKGDN